MSTRRLSSTGDGASFPVAASAKVATRRPARWTSAALELIGMIAVIAMMVHVVLEVTMRTIFNAPLSGTMEMVAFWYMILISFIGMWLAQRRNEQISVTLVFDRLGLRARQVLAVVGNSLAIVLLALFVWYGLQGALHQASIGEFTGSAQIPIWPMRFVVPVTLTAWIFVLIAQTVEILRHPEVMNVDDDYDEELEVA